MTTTSLDPSGNPNPKPDDADITRTEPEQKPAETPSD